MSRLSKSSLAFGLKRKIHDVIHDVERYRLGRILTIIDASIADPQQRKALKDLMHDAFDSKEYYSCSLPQIIFQFCNRLGVNLFDSSSSEREFLNDAWTESTDPHAVPTPQDYFPEGDFAEDSSVAQGKGK